MITWFVSIPILAVYLIWKKTTWNKGVKLVASIGAVVLFFGVFSSFGDSSGSSTTREAVKVSEPQTKQVYNIPTLLNKNIEEIKVDLGTPEGDSEPTKQQLALGTTEWDKYWNKDGEDMSITYNVKTRKVVDFFISTSDPSGVTSDKNALLAVGGLKTDDPAYEIEFVNSVTDKGKFTGVKVVPVDLKQKEALAKERKTFDDKRGNSLFAAQQAQEIIKAVKSAGIGADVYIQADVPEAISSDYLQGGKESTYREKATIARMSIVINSNAWALAPDTSKRDLVASLVNRLKQMFPNAVPRVEVNNGVRAVANGSWSLLNEEPKIELK